MDQFQLLGRTLKVDYVEEYKVPKYREDADEDVKRLWEEGCAPKPIQWTVMRKQVRSISLIPCQEGVPNIRGVAAVRCARCPTARPLGQRARGDRYLPECRAASRCALRHAHLTCCCSLYGWRNEKN